MVILEFKVKPKTHQLQFLQFIVHIIEKSHYFV